MKYVLIILFISIPVLCFCPTNNDKQQTIREYNSMIEYIKQREGLRLKNYYDLDSQILIGYGCNIRYNGKLSPEINAKQADSLLRIRFNKCLVIALKYESERKKKLITADKIFRYGELNFKKYFNYDN